MKYRTEGGILSRVFYLLAMLLTVAAAAYFVAPFFEGEVQDGIWPENRRTWGLFAAIGVGMVHMGISAACFSRCMNGERNVAAKLFVIYLISQLGKYVPGRIWAPFIQRYLLGRGASTARIIEANVEVVLVGIAAHVMGATMVLAGVSYGMAPATAVLAVGSTTVLLVSRGLQRWPILSRLRPSGASGLLERPTLVLGWVLALSVSGALAWISVYALWLGFDFRESLGLYGISGISLVTGVLSVLPAGLGVREASFLWLADSGWFLKVESPATVALHGRAWLLLVDAGSILLASVLLLSNKSKFE